MTTTPPKSNRNPAPLTDLLFSVLFGATFAFKLGILAMGYGLNLSAALLPYFVFFGYSILFVWVYWQFIRIETTPVGKRSSTAPGLVFIFTIVESMAPYVALPLATELDGHLLDLNEILMVGIAIATQLASVVIMRHLKKRWHL